MDELFLPKNDGKLETADFVLATVSAVYTNGVSLIFDGQNAASQKRYRLLQTGSTVRAGERVVVMKHSGTYVVLGGIIDGGGIYHTSKTSDFLTTNSNFTVNGGDFARCGNIASIYVYGDWNITGSSSDYTAFTLKEGFRPFITCMARAWRNSNAILYWNGNMVFHSDVTSGNGATFLCTYLLQ